MSPHFKSYVSNLNRVLLAELIDYHTARLRHSKVRLSIVNNPLIDQPCAGNECEAVATATKTQAA
jgi:hypothetical protein